MAEQDTPTESIFREPKPPKPPKPKKIRKTPRTILKKRAIAQRKKEKLEAKRRSEEVGRQAQKMAIMKTGEELFGEGGLTPERQRVLSEVLTGDDGLVIASSQQLKFLTRKAREKFLQHASDYIDMHVKSVRTALTAGEFDTAARHAEWAMERLGDGNQERVTDPPARTAVPGGGAAPQPIMLGVQLGSMPTQK